MIKTTNVYVFWKGCILLIQRARNDENLPSYWESPAGHVDIYCPKGDSQQSRDEALRELREETGIHANLEQLVYLPRFSNNEHSSYLLVCESALPPKVKLSFEHDAFRWYSLTQPICIQNIRPEVTYFIRSYQYA